ADVAGDALAAEFQLVQRLLHRQAADRLGDQVQLLGADPDVHQLGAGLGRGDPTGVLGLGHRLLPLGLLVRRVAREVPGRGELAALHADHLFRDEHRHVLLAIVNAGGQTDELRRDGGAARPGRDHGLAARRLNGVGLLEQIPVDERAFPGGAGHRLASLLHVAATDDELVRGLVLAGAGALGVLAPRGDRRTAARGATLTTTVRVVDRVHGDAADVRTEAHVTLAARLAEVLVHVVGIRHRAHRGHAAVQDHAQLARAEADLGVAGVAADQLGVGAGRTGQLGALARLHLDVVDDRTHRHRAQRHGVARLHVDLLAGHDRVARLQALRRDDVRLLTVGVGHQRDEGGPVRIVLQTLDGRFGELAALEVDLAVQGLGPAAAEANGHATALPATARLGQAFGQRLFRTPLVELRAVDQHQGTTARRGRIVVLQSHRIRAPW